MCARIVKLQRVRVLRTQWHCGRRVTRPRARRRQGSSEPGAERWRLRSRRHDPTPPHLLSVWCLATTSVALCSAARETVKLCSPIACQVFAAHCAGILNLHGWPNRTMTPTCLRWVSTCLLKAKRARSLIPGWILCLRGTVTRGGSPRSTLSKAEAYATRSAHAGGSTNLVESRLTFASLCAGFWSRSHHRIRVTNHMFDGPAIDDGGSCTKPELACYQ